MTSRKWVMLCWIGFFNKISCDFLTDHPEDLIANTYTACSLFILSAGWVHFSVNKNIMRALLFMLILAVLLSSTLAMPYEGRNERKTPNNGILHYLAYIYLETVCIIHLSISLVKQICLRSNSESMFYTINHTTIIVSKW